ncbi:MAG: NAD(P)H-dependent oxidoreductase [Microcoleus sp. SIO2G3]|nr:NAD(P)H-dependent oxidoreductase [Microcoleus sp. SIO2G3]
MKILAVSGSLRSSSSNTAILRLISHFAPEPFEIDLYDSIGNLPHFNPEFDGENPPASVKKWRDRLQQSDAVLICTPEYAHGVPGVLKNAFDWIVSSGELMHKPTAVISASPLPDGGEKANASLVQTLSVMLAKIPQGAIVKIPGVSTKLNQGEVTDPTTIQALRSLLDALAQS